MKSLFAALPLLVTLTWGQLLQADGPADNDPSKVRRVPRAGIAVPVPIRQKLQQGLAKLAQQISNLRASKSPLAQRLLPDVEIFHRAVTVALKHNEFFAMNDLKAAERILAVGQQRAKDLAAGKAPWTTQTGFVVRGFRSRLDRSVQPYGLVVPANYRSRGYGSHRLDLWFHGRGETLSEVKFLEQHRYKGRPVPRSLWAEEAFVLHPYGRYSNAFKFAGEVDVLEAHEHVRKNYRIDEDRVAVRGFSMGGAGCWQFAVHYADRWFAATPGAGFSETPEFLKFFQKEKLTPTWYEKKLWHLYDCTDYALNLTHCPTIAYSGEIDIQKQAADIMETALANENIDMVHLIGPKTGHRIHPQAKAEIERRLRLLARQGRQRLPHTVHLVTYTLKYNRMHWVTIDRLQEHWSRSQVTARLHGNSIDIKTSGVTQLTLDMLPGKCPLDPKRTIAIKINGKTVQGTAPTVRSDRSWKCHLTATAAGGWQVARRSEGELAKAHDLQGPIDDAFMDSFIMVRPTGRAQFPSIDKWSKSELNHAIEHWRRQFRGDAVVKNDVDVSPADIARSNLILFGDAHSNSVIRDIAEALPITWGDKQIKAGDRNYAASHHALICIYPNPRNPQRYVVLNSGFTYREYDYLNNARQVPKLPDWAIVDVRQPATSRYPGAIVDADFFGEKWELRKTRAR